MDEWQAFDQERQEMITWQIAARGIQDRRVLEVMGRIPRHCFVSPEYQSEAYQDHPLPIGSGQTISQPYVIAVMTELLRLEGDEVVLEVGTGSGYQAAILSCLAARVHTIEYSPVLAGSARSALARLGIANVTVHQGDGSLGLETLAPFGGILVTAAAPEVPKPLLEQLGETARLVIPVGGPGHQELQVWQRSGNGFDHESIFPVIFVPLRGALGWKEDQWGHCEIL